MGTRILRPRPAGLAALLAGLAAVASVASGCYARSVPVGPRPPAAPPAPPLPLTAGIRAGEHGGNVARIHPSDVLTRFAADLERAGLFAGVVYPLTELAAFEPDLVLELSVGSRHDLHTLSNLARDVAVGVSALLLQPLLPTSYDLRVDLTLRVRSPGGSGLSQHRQTSQHRFEYTWFQPSEASIAAWHAGTAREAIRALIDRLAGDRERLRRAVSPPPAARESGGRREAPG